MTPALRHFSSVFIAYVYLCQVACLSGGAASEDDTAGNDSPPRAHASRGDALVSVPRQLLPTAPGEALAPRAGAFDVSPDGAATWSMPLWTPPGRNGIEPSLAVTYNSKAGSGWLGLGFSVSGFSSIARCNKTLAQDGVYSSGPIPDEFCLDGQRLVQTSPAGSTPIVFSPEFQPGTRVQILSRPSDPPYADTRSNPWVFEVRTADGRISEYGTMSPSNAARVEGPTLSVEPAPPVAPLALSDDSVEIPGPKRAVTWLLSSVRDRWGNLMSIDYEYTVDTNKNLEVLPKEIRWGGYATSPTKKATLTFGESKVDPRSGFRAGLPITSSKRLTNLRVMGEDRLTSEAAPSSPSLHPLREYRFAYRPVAPGARPVDRLESITECVNNSPSYTSANWTCVDPVSFSWSGETNPVLPTFTRTSIPGASQWTYSSTTSFSEEPNQELASDLADLAVGDYNGDGRDDILFRVPSIDANGRIKFRYVDTGALLTSPVGMGSWRLALGTEGGLDGPIDPGLPANTLGGTLAQSPRVLDIENRGASDVVLNFAPPSGLGLPTAEDSRIFKLNASTLFVERTALHDSHGTPTLPSPLPVAGLDFTAADFNGDGFLDVLRDEEPSPPFSSSSSLTALSLRKGVFGPDFLLGAKLLDSSGAEVLAAKGEERRVADVDGTGQLAILTRFRGTGLHYLSHFALTKLNADGTAAAVRPTSLPALPVSSSSVMYRVADYTGTPSTSIGGFTRWFLDVNGDGLADSVAIPETRALTFGPAAPWLAPPVMNVSIPLIAVNIGGDFRQPQGNRLRRTEAPGPVYYAGPFGPRRVDSGTRIADVDGDGRQDLLLVGPSPAEDAAGVYGSKPVPAVYGGRGPARSNMTVLRSTSTGFEPMALNVPITDFGHIAPANEPIDGSLLKAGYGPRMTRLGDFNGDGLFDIVTSEEATTQQETTRRLVLYLQDRSSRAPDVVTAFTGGPHTPSVTVQYEWGGPKDSSPYTPASGCNYPQRCLKHVGWVVKQHAVEATGFDDAVTSNTFTHEYEDAREDLRGRGFLGARKYTRLDTTDSSNISRTVEFDLNTRTLAATSAGMPRYAYVGAHVPVQMTTSTPLNGGTYVVGSTTVLTPIETSGVYQISTTRVVTSEVDRGSHVRSTRVTRTVDGFGNPLTILREDTEKTIAANSPPLGAGTISTRRWSAIGPNDAITDSTWLTSRYKGFTETSTEPGTLAPVTRTTNVTYWRDRVEPWKIDQETLAPPENNDPSGKATSSGLAQTTWIVRDAHGNVTEVHEVPYFLANTTAALLPQERVTRIDYDPTEATFPVSETNPLGHTTKLSFHAGLGVLVARDDANGIRSQVTYDSLLRPRVLQTGIRTSDGALGGHQESWEYLSDTQPSAPGGARLRTYTVRHASEAAGTEWIQQDPMGRALKRTTESLQQEYDSQVFRYDRYGRMTHSSLPRRAAERSPASFGSYDHNIATYDALGRVESISHPGESRNAPRGASRFRYNARETTQVSERSVEKRTLVDARGRTIELGIKEPGTGREVLTTYEYAPFDLLRHIAHPALNSDISQPGPKALDTFMTYDILGRQESIEDPDVGRIELRYDGFGQLKLRTEVKTHAATSYGHDLLGRPTFIQTNKVAGVYLSSAHNAFAQNTTYVWDSLVPGALTSVASNDDIARSWTYDDFGRTKTTEWQVQGKAYRFGMSYDSIGRLERLAYPRSASGQKFEVEFGYAPSGEVESVSDVSNLTRPGPHPQVSVPAVWRQVSRNAAGLSTEEAFGNTESTRRVYDEANRLRFVQSSFLPGPGSTPWASSTPFQTLAYRWGPDGFLRSRSDTQVKSVEVFEHDFLGRLSTWEVQQNCEDAKWRYDYDDWGNRKRSAPYAASGMT